MQTTADIVMSLRSFPTHFYCIANQITHLKFFDSHYEYILRIQYVSLLAVKGIRSQNIMLGKVRRKVNAL